jgi:hypothetical protein
MESLPTHVVDQPAPQLTEPRRRGRASLVWCDGRFPAPQRREGEKNEPSGEEPR